MSGVPTSGSVPDELASAVRRAAETVPDHRGDLATVRRRWRTRRRRRAVLTAGSLVCLVAATAAGIPALTPDGTSGDGTTDDTAVASVVRDQRLLLNVAGLTVYDRPGGHTVGLARSDGVPEVGRDGATVVRPVPEGWQRETVGLPDGRIVGLRVAVSPAAGSAEPGGAARDGADPGGGVPDSGAAEVEAADVELVVLGANGAVTLSRDLGAPRKQVSLVGATDRDAYLARGDSVVRHDLSTGAETVVLPAGSAGDLSRAAAADLSGRFLALPYGSRECGVRIFDLVDGRLSGTVTGEGICYGILRLSPDGRLLAVAALPPVGPAIRTRPPRVTVYETSTGAIRADQLLQDQQSGSVNLKSGAGGLAWLDDHEVRVARVVFPPKADRIYRIDEVVRISTVPVR
ncbi:hypothetical protein [Plantactinospora sonchi]|uniref:Uncharacterized protein n=1 Tax=Plantactinospora sonchi TaxID=1544735 RepID=A0ABU7RSE6_9ACTN